VSRALPVIAPRGKEFAIARLDLAVAASTIVVSKARWQLLEQAQKFAADIDWRLSPMVIVVERPRAAA
jgi:hypothetical protein